MREDVELCLDIEVDPASKRILSNPEKCRSALLDVTVIKPKELEAFGTHRTSTLRADEVRKLITSMEKQRQKKQKVLDKLKCEDTVIKVRKHDEFEDYYRRPKKSYVKYKSPIDDRERKDFIGISKSVEPLFCEIRRSLKNVETRISNMKDINLTIGQTTVDESTSEEFVFPRKRKPHNPFTLYNHLKNPIVYRAETTSGDVQSMLCKNQKKYREHGERFEGKCEYCGNVGPLQEWEKHSFTSESPSLSDYGRLHRKKKTRFNLRKLDAKKRNSLDDITYINQLTKRVKMLEQRLAEQEDRVVPKDYFRKIMSKMLSKCSPKLVKSKSELSEPCSERQKKVNMQLNEKLDETSKLLDKAFRRQSTETINCFRANLNLLTTESPNRTKPNTVHEKVTKTDKATITNNDAEEKNTWKWGEEILKPGIDLKNRIVTLLNDMLSKFNLTENCSAPQSVKPNVPGSSKNEDCSSEMTKKFTNNFNPKIFNAQIERHINDVRNDKHIKLVGFQKTVRENYKKENAEKSRKKEGKNVDISYVNPKLKQWQKDVPKEVKRESSPATDPKLKADGKKEFLKLMSKVKQHRKDELWGHIWSQVKAGGKSKEDEITIKIPVPKKDNKGFDLFEAVLTIGEVEAILKGFSWP